MTVAARLLTWYDVHARMLPWRSATPDPYAVWLSEIMLQQTTVAAATPYYERFLARWPTVEALAAADNGEVMHEWAGLGYYSRARNLLAAARIMASDGIPADEAGWRALPGVGRYTAAAVAAIALRQRAVVVDGNVKRVVARLFAVETPLPAEAELYRLTDSITPTERAGDFAQAMMDLGATVCTPRSPRCLLCPLSEDCHARALGCPDKFPVRAAKRPQPERTATALWIEHDGRVALVRRPPSGLLGGMLGLPMAEEETKGLLLATIVHVFTHFRLTLAVRGGGVAAAPEDAQWVARDRLLDAGLPGLFKKAAQAVLDGGDEDVRRAA